MAVPDTDTFSMSDVAIEVGSGDDLVELFALAEVQGGTFDPVYVGDKTNLLNFRNYSNVPKMKCYIMPSAVSGTVTQWEVAVNGGPRVVPSGFVEFGPGDTMQAFASSTKTIPDPGWSVRWKNSVSGQIINQNVFTEVPWMSIPRDYTTLPAYEGGDIDLILVDP